VLARSIFGATVATVLAGCIDWEALSTSYDPDAPLDVACAAFVLAGATHSCARLTDGRLYCWGDNRFGQLGTGDRAARPRPTEISVGGLAVGRVDLPAGGGDLTSPLGVFACAITTDAALWCWGDNAHGQLGQGTLEPSPTPARVATLSGVARAAGGGSHVCAHTHAGALHCWGRNLEGQLGTASLRSRSSPVAVTTGQAVDRVAAGVAHSCARGTDGSLRCWGANDRGQLGDGTTDGRPSPVLVSGLDGVQSVAAGGRHSCAYTTSGTAHCWGDNARGQLGSSAGAMVTAPTAVALPNGVKVAHVYAGGLHACALDAGAELWCWGDNEHGQLGTDDVESRATPAPAASETLGTDVAAASAGGAHSCAVKRDGSAWCWGDNLYGQLGVPGTPAQSRTPVRVIAPCR
jgi:hypothetical protein